MKKLSIYIALVLAFGTFRGALALAQTGSVVAAVPGNTVVQDPAGDLLLKNCDPIQSEIPCSLPPNPQLPLPDWFDLKTAKITEIGEGQVDLHIELYAPIPAAPLVPFVSYIWQFQDGCVVPSPTDKTSISVVWDGDTQTWSANWFVITSCNPRTIIEGDPVPFGFTEDGVKVRVLLSDLLPSGASPESLLWFAAVRRLPFSHPTFKRTVPVDVAPDVIAFNPTPPPVLIEPEDSATWDPR